jgi:hypothetical protein
LETVHRTHWSKLFVELELSKYPELQREHWLRFKHKVQKGMGQSIQTSNNPVGLKLIK